MAVNVFIAVYWYYQKGLPLGKLVVVSAKVDEDLKRRAERLGINISAVVRKALEEEVKRAELDGLLQKLKEEIDKAPSLPEGAVADIIREMREGRIVS